MNENRYGVFTEGIACILLLSAAMLTAQPSADGRSISIGLRGGAFAPQDQSIQGLETVTYDVGGSPTVLIISGFGPGGEVQLQAGLSRGNSKVWVLELGGRLQRRQAEMSLAPNGEWDRYDNEMTVAFASVSRIYRFPLETSKIVPYLGAGFAAQLIRQEMLHEPEVGARLWYRGESVVPGFQLAAGWRTSIYYDLFLDTQFKYSYCMGKMRIRNEDTGTEIEYHKLNLGGFSLLLGLSIDIKPRD